jgi:hypothetical protein
VTTVPQRPSGARRMTALSLGGLRRRIEVLLLPDDVEVRLVLDRRTRQERDRRRAAAGNGRAAAVSRGSGPFRSQSPR